MRLWLCLVALALLAERPEPVAVRAHDGVVDVRAWSANLADLLDAVARETGMKVIYEGPRPATRVSIDVRGRTGVQAVSSIFEGLGVSYALAADRDGMRVAILIVSDAAASGSASPSGRAAAVRPAPELRPQRYPDEPPLTNPEIPSLAAPPPDPPDIPAPPLAAPNPSPAPAEAPAPSSRAEPLQIPVKPAATPSPPPNP